MSIIWYTSTNGSNWTLMKSPTTYKLGFEDLDKDSYRSVMTGDLIRNVLKRRWVKLSMSWNVLSENEVSAICSAVNRDDVYFRVKSPAWGSFLTFKGYVSKIETELLEGMVGYSLNLNVVQMEGASHQ